MKISIIVPIYNSEKYLRQCIESILNQKYSEIEVILVDDGSNDGSAEIIDRYADLDARVIVVHKENGGLSSARNVGLDWASGDWVGFVDSDDYLHPNFYYELVQKVVAYSNVAVVSSDFYYVEAGELTTFRKDWEINREINYLALEYSQMVLKDEVSTTVWNKLYKGDLCKKQRFVENRLNEDFLFLYHFSRQMIDNNLIAISIPDKLYYYRKNYSSITNTRLVVTLVDQVRNINDVAREYDNLPENLQEAVDCRRVKKYTSMLHFLALNAYESTYWNDYYGDYRAIRITDFIGYLEGKELFVGLILRICPQVFAKKNLWRCFKSLYSHVFNMNA